MAVARTATLLFTETAGAGTYTAAIGVQPGAAVEMVYIVALAAPWAATTVVLDMGDVLTGASAYFGGYNVANLSVYDPTNAQVGANFDTLLASGNNYAPLGLPWPGVQYAAPDVISAVIVTTGAGGATGILAVEITGYGIPGATHHAAKV